MDQVRERHHRAVRALGDQRQPVPRLAEPLDGRARRERLGAEVAHPAAVEGAALVHRADGVRVVPLDRPDGHPRPVGQRHALGRGGRRRDRQRRAHQRVRAGGLGRGERQPGTGQPHRPLPGPDGQHVALVVVGDGRGRPRRLVRAQELGQDFGQRVRFDTRPGSEGQRARRFVHQLARARGDDGRARTARRRRRAGQLVRARTAGRHVHDELVHHALGPDLDGQPEDVRAARGQGRGQRGEAPGAVLDLGADAQQRHGQVPFRRGSTRPLSRGGVTRSLHRREAGVSPFPPLLSGSARAPSVPWVICVLPVPGGGFRRPGR